MARGRRRPIHPAPVPEFERAVERLRRRWREDPADAAARGREEPTAWSYVLARLAVDAVHADDLETAKEHLRTLRRVRRGSRDAVAAALVAVGDAHHARGEDGPAEDRWIEAQYRARHALGRGYALARLALLYRDRDIPLGFRFYSGRALRVIERGHAAGLHPAADPVFAELAVADLDYHLRRDDPGRARRARAVLDAVEDVDPRLKVRGLKLHGLALGRTDDIAGACDTFLDAADIIEERDLRGCDGVFVYAAMAVFQLEGDFPHVNELFQKAHIRRLEPEEKVIYRQLRELVRTALATRPLAATKAERFLRNKRRRERAAERKALAAIEAEREAAVEDAAEPPKPKAKAKPKSKAKSKAKAKAKTKAKAKKKATRKKSK